MNLRDQILQKNDYKLTPVEVPEWDCTVHVRSISGAQREELAKKIKDAEKQGLKVPPGLIPWMLVRTVCNEDGSLMFTDKDIAALNEKNPEVTDRICQESFLACGVTPDAAEEAEKN